MADRHDRYSASARSYDLLIEPFARHMRRLGLRMVSPQPGAKVLDVGCGTGSQLALYADAGCRVWGVDSSAAMLAVARRKLAADAGLYLGDGTSLPFSDGEFDLTTITLVLHETPRRVRGAILREAARVTGPDGRLLLTDYHVGPVRRPTGRLFHLAGRIVEAWVGGEHYRNYRDFVANGGLPPLIAGAGLEVEEERSALVEAFVVCLVRRR